MSIASTGGNKELVIKIRADAKEAGRTFEDLKKQFFEQSKVLRQMSIDGKQATDAYRNLATQQKALGTVIQQLNREGKGMSPWLTASKYQLAEFYENVTTVTAGVYILGKALYDLSKESIEQGAKLKVLRENYKGTADDLELLKKATAGTLTEAQLIPIFNKATEQMKITTNETARLLAYSEDLADKGIGTLTENFGSLTTAILTGGRGLRTLGIDQKQFKEDLAKLNETALSNATSETASLRVLANVINSETTSRKQKVESIENLQKMYPHIFSNLDKDSEKTKILTGDIDKLTEAIFAREAAEVFSSAAGKEYQNKIGYIQKYTNLSKELTDLRMQRANMEEGQLKAMTAQDASNKEAQIISDIKATSVLIGNSDKITAAYVRNAATMAQTGFMATKPAAGGGTKKADVKRPTITAIPKMEIAKTSDEENDRILAMFRDSLSTDLNNFAKDPIVLNIPVQATVDITPAETEMQRIQNLLNEFNAGASELINTSIADTFGQLGTAIGTALANGGNVFKAIGSTILQSLGKFLSDMGGMLIQYGTLAVVKGKLDLAIATGGPAAIVAGIAAIGVGIALKAIGGAISAKASGQGSGASVQGGNSYSSPSSSNSSGGGGSFSGGTVVFEISGQTLIGVLSNTLDRNKRLGGALAL